MILEHKKGVSLIYDAQYLMIQLRNQSPFVICRLQKETHALTSLRDYMKTTSYKTLKKGIKNQIKMIHDSYSLTIALNNHR